MQKNSTSSREQKASWLHSKAAGYAVLALVVFVWASFAVTLRSLANSELTTNDVAIVRFIIPAIVLFPFFKSRIGSIRKAAPKDLLLILMGGIPFFFVAAAGAKLTSAAHVGALIAGTSPVTLAIISWGLEGKKIGFRNLLPLALILFGAFAMVFGRGSLLQGPALQGSALLISASFLWSFYTIGVRRSRLDAIAVGSLVSTGSLALLPLAILLNGGGINFSQVPFFTQLPVILVQGIGVGLVSTVGYSFSISRVGAVQSATIGSLAPALASLLAIPVLHEAITASTAIAIAMITAGVILASRQGGTTRNQSRS